MAKMDGSSWKFLEMAGMLELTGNGCKRHKMDGNG